jgi:hypothetical protein
MRFAQQIKERQIEWARLAGKGQFLEEKREWVFRKGFEAENLFDPSWMRLIDRRKQHRWFRALNSSQAFAINLFGPVASDTKLAASVFSRLFPKRGPVGNPEVKVRLEYTPDAGPLWLGEKNNGQPTQIDVAFFVRHGVKLIGATLVEVKLSEPFGMCRGFKHQQKSGTAPSPCSDARSVLADPQANCWMVSNENRRYWQILKSAKPPLTFDVLPAGAACPFRRGLYQLMRNTALAKALVSQGAAEWCEFAVCSHPSNDSAGGKELAEFRSIFGESAVLSVDPRVVVSAILECHKRLSSWAEYMRKRYGL